MHKCIDGNSKKFIKKLKFDGSVGCVLKELFPKICKAKLKEGVLIGPNIAKLIKCETFNEGLPEKEQQ